MFDLTLWVSQAVEPDNTWAIMTLPPCRLDQQCSRRQCRSVSPTALFNCACATSIQSCPSTSIAGSLDQTLLLLGAS